MDSKALIHNSESSCSRSMVRRMLQLTKPPYVNVQRNSHSPGRTVCSDSGTHDTGFKYIAPTLLDRNENSALQRFRG